MALRYFVLVQLYNKEGLGELSFFQYLIENRFHKNTLFDQLQKDRKHLAQFVPKVAKIRVFSSDSSSEKKKRIFTLSPTLHQYKRENTEIVGESCAREMKTKI